MLGIRLRPDEEDRLERHARSLGRAKSALAREWIVERLDRESIDALVAHAAARIAANETGDQARAHGAWFAALDAEDGGYDWGPDGPPALA